MSLQTPTTIRSRPNKLYGKAKATPIGRRRGPAVKSVGKPDALIGHVRFDERGRETERLAKPQAAAPFLDSTCALQARFSSSLSDLTFGPLISLPFFKFVRNTIPNDINILPGTKRSSPTNC